MSAVMKPSPSFTPSSTIETITPDEARKYLDSNTHNRAPISKAIDEYARAMREGQWSLNGQSIVFDADGVLIDGQNRLMACVMSGVPFQTWVVRGVADARAFVTTDVGRSRNARDMLTYRHNDMRPVTAKRVAAAARVVSAWDSCENKSAFVGYALCGGGTAEEWARIAERYMPRIAEIVELIGRRFDKMVAESIIHGCAVILYRIDEGAAHDFFRQLEDGVFSATDHPVKQLRDALAFRARDGRLNRRMIAREQMALIFKAWNAWRSGKQIKQLRFIDSGEKPESFPVPK